MTTRAAFGTASDAPETGQTPLGDTSAAAATGIAHDLKNLLAAIAGSLELAQHDPDGAEQCMRTAAQATDRAQGLVEYLMHLQAAEGHAEWVDLKAMLRETAAFVTAVPHAPAVQLDLDNVHVLRGVFGEKRQLERAVLNLVVNACEAVEERAGRPHDTPYAPALRIALEMDAIGTEPAVAVVVGDNGTGIPEALRDRIFEPFVTGKAERGGTGLGLSIVRAIVRDHHGRIDLDSTEGQGTVFRMVLPVGGAGD